MVDVLAFGELLIDFSPAGSGKMGNPAFEMNPGGAPVNCVSAVARLGGSAAYIGKVGKDLFGNFILQKMEDFGIDTSGVIVTDETHTTLAFVSISPDGEREFSFLRKNGADILLRSGDVDFKKLDDARILHFGGLSFTDQPSREASFHILEEAKAKNLKMSYDPNYRPLLWKNKAEAVEYMRQALDYANIVKMSEEEMELILDIDKNRPEEGARKLVEMGKEIALITVGSKGAYFASGDESRFVPGFTVRAQDTTGCGDSFTGAFLYMLLYRPETSIREKVEFSNAVGALCATRMGGMPAMPTFSETKNFMEAYKNEDN
jgi:fructokinase